MPGFLPDGLTAALDVIRPQEKAIYAEEAMAASGMAASRRDEFLAGRRVARRAFGALGFPPGAIARGADGLPVPPPGLRLSISHCRGLVAVAAGRSAAWELFGFDLERTDRIRERALAHVLIGAERVATGSSQLAGSVVFSLKEAIFKAQYPVFRAGLRFSDVELGFDEARRTARIVNLGPGVPPELAAASGRLQLRYVLWGQYVASLVWAEVPTLGHTGSQGCASMRSK